MIQLKCECRHLKKKHSSLGCLIKYHRKEDESSLSYTYCDCEQYKADNLKYLEECAEKKGLIC